MNTKKKNTLFLIAYTIYYMGLVIEHTAYIYAAQVKGILSVLAIILLFIKFIVNSSNCLIRKGEINIYLLITVMSLLAIATRDFFVFVLVLFFLNIRDVEEEVIENIFKLSIIINGIILVLTLMLCWIGVIPNLSFPRTYFSEPRWAYGFEHSQILSLLFLYVVLYYYTSKKKVGVISFVVFQAVSVFLAIFFDTRNAICSLEIFYLIYFMHTFCKMITRKRYNRFTEILYFVASYSVTIMGGVSFMVLWLYTRGVGIIEKIDAFLTGRISLAWRSFEIFPPKMIRAMTFSEYRSSLQSTMDNGYYYLVFRYGFAYLVIMAIICCFIARYYKSRGNKCGASALVTIAVACTVANGFVGCYFYPFWMVAFYSIHDRLKNRGMK